MNEDKIRKQLEIYLRDNNKDLKNAIEVIRKKYEEGLLTGRFEIPTAEGSKYIFSYEQGIMCEIKDSDYQSYLIYDEYRKTDNVKFFQRDLRFDGFYEHYPPEFKEVIKSLKEGQVVTFNNGNTYVVTITKNKLLLKPIYSNNDVEKIEMEVFRKEKPYMLDFSESGKLEYRNLYKELTQCKILNASLRYTNKLDMDKKVKELEKKLKKSETHSLFVGNNRFYVRHTLIGPLWYDACGKRIPRKLFTYFLAWVETAPVIIEIHEKDPVKSDILKNEAFLYDIESLLGQRKFDEVYDYVLNNLPEDNDFELHIKSIQKDGDDYKKEKFIFKKENNELSVDTKQIDEIAFREFLKEKYMTKHLSILKIKTDKKRTPRKSGKTYLESSTKIIDDRLVQKECKKQIDDQVAILLNEFQSNENKGDDIVKLENISLSEEYGGTMKLVTNCDKRYLNHNLMAAKAIKLDVYIGKAYDMKGNYLPDVYGIYAKEEDFTHYMNCKFWAAVERLGIKLLKQWEAKGYDVGDALGFQFYLDMPEEAVKRIEQKLKNKKKNGI